MRQLAPADRLSLTALAVADVGVGVFLIAVGSLPMVPWLHAWVGVVALLLALPAAATAITGRLPALADEGMLLNVAAMVFVTSEVMSLPAAMGQRVGLAILVASATLATIGLYLRLFGVLRLPKFEMRGRHHDQ